MILFRSKSSGSNQAQTTRDAREHMEGHHRRPSDAADEAPPEEVRAVGEPGPSDRPARSAPAGNEEIGDVQGPDESAADVAVAVAEEGGVAEPGRAEPPGGGVHTEVQRGNEAAEAGVFESVQGDDEPGFVVAHKHDSKGTN